MDLKDKTEQEAVQSARDNNSEEQQCEKNKNFLESFRHALDGILTVYQEEANLKIHLSLGLIVVILCWALGINQTEWLWMILVVFLVIVMEIWNTVIENLVDLAANKEYHPLAKKAKDMAAAAVLVTAGFAVVVGGIILLPKIYHLFF